VVAAFPLHFLSILLIESLMELFFILETPQNLLGVIIDKRLEGAELDFIGFLPLKVDLLLHLDLLALLVQLLMLPPQISLDAFIVLHGLVLNPSKVLHLEPLLIAEVL